MSGQALEDLLCTAEENGAKEESSPLKTSQINDDDPQVCWVREARRSGTDKAASDKELEQKVRITPCSKNTFSHAAGILYMFVQCPDGFTTRKLIYFLLGIKRPGAECQFFT